MALVNEIPVIVEEYQRFKTRLYHNAILFDIYEGNLLPYIEADLSSQMSAESFNQLRPRIAPINVLKKIIDKLSKIYAKPPTRRLLKESEQDEVLFEYYQRVLSIDSEMSVANEIFNLEKYVLVEPMIDDGMPFLNIPKPDSFLVLNLNPVNKKKMTHYIKIAGCYKKEVNKVECEKTILYVYTDTEFLIINEDGEILSKEMEKLNNTGINVIGKIPAVYIPKSSFDLIPREDTDTLAMTKMIPCMISGMNDVAFWQSFAIVYGIDLSDENLKRAPNVMWNFKTDPTSNQKPEIGTIKPEADTDKVISLILFQLSAWLDSKGIKAGSIGQADASASGIAKVIDESDTSSSRNAQIPFFKKGESELWNLIFNYMHPYWVKTKMIDIREVFTPNQRAIVEFAEQMPIVDRKTLIDEAILELTNRITTRARAIKKINPDMEKGEIEKMLEEIDEEYSIEIPEEMSKDNMDGSDATNENSNQDSKEVQTGREGSDSLRNY
jgi:hypothetical protein